MKEIWLAIIPATLPTLAVLVGILLNQNAITRLETRLSVIEGDLRRFYQILGEHTGAIDALKNKTK